MPNPLGMVGGGRGSLQHGRKISCWPCRVDRGSWNGSKLERRPVRLEATNTLVAAFCRVDRANAAREALRHAKGDRKAAYSRYIQMHYQSTGGLAPGCDNKDLQAWYDENKYS